MTNNYNSLGNIYKTSGMYSEFEDIENVPMQILELFTKVFTKDEFPKQGKRDDTIIYDAAACIKNLEALSDNIKNAESEMRRRREKVDCKIVELKKYVLNIMESMEVSVLAENPYFQIKTRKNPPSLVIDCQNDIPDEYREKVVTEKIRNDKIKDALKMGEYFEWAHLESSKSLVIK